MENTRRRKQPPLPSSVRVGGRRYSIDVIETMLSRGEMARIEYENGKIRIGKRSNVTGKPYSSAQLSESFFHELVHAILYDMNEHKLNKNEAFVTEFAKRLSKAIRSRRF